MKAMSRRDPDVVAGIYVALVSVTMMLALIGAFVLPGWISLSKWLGIAVLAGVFIGVPVLDRLAHRSRIREAVEETGVNIVCIKRLPFWRQFDESMAILKYLPIARRIKHEVDYTDVTGALRHATCRSGWFYGVEWLDDVIVSA